TTEWHEAVEASAGRMVIVGLDRRRASAELARVAAPAAGRDDVHGRVPSAVIAPSGAAAAIVQALGAGVGG
ncbi:MAG: hypothetical protein HY264_09730, partial [Chloroflexi bacterium]|nr:hypothetical protein [Chloroflexota bacterium]